ncbi:MAG: hypothetical protein U0531_18350, partial [Dehalococcoidia bacterium]
MVAAVATVAAGAPVIMALWQVVRNPGGYTRLALLLMMAVAVGAFAASYSSTADRSYRDRASFEAGVDLRAATTLGLDRTPTEAAAELEALPGVARAAAALRGRATTATPGASGQAIALLGLDPEAAAGLGGAPPLLWFREDLAAEPFTELMGRLRGPAPRGRPLPDGATAVSVWVNPGQPRDNLTLWVRVRDRTGNVAMFELGRLDFAGWRQLRTPLQDRFGPTLTPPLAIASLVLSEPSNIALAQTPPLYLDDITAEGPGGSVVVEDFEATLAWTAAPSPVARAGAGGTQDELRLTSEQRHGGASSARFSFRPGVSSGLRGIYLNEPSLPLPVIVSPEFLDLTGATPGGQALV